ncbi:tetratricopeptide repeat protein [uncultured Arcobacter sp.]|uniref:tetratricopeptide repeat protein n=1 Tax=uncultured Arcobacter sp. TaxID=165434 RepID=UPI00262C8D55|nr:tetratricopeptide repeat protein [uncultured Arcobacter sp.]
MNKFLIVILLSTLTYAKEVSVFGAGNLDSSNPYGLTKSEQRILKNKKELGSIDTKVKTVKSTMDSISERIDGLESIYEGDSQKLNSVVLTLTKLLNDFESNQNLTDKNGEDVKELKKSIDQLNTLQKKIADENQKNLENLKQAVEKLTKKINVIDSNYISEKDFKKNMNQFVTVKEFEALKKSLNIKTNEIAQPKISVKSNNSENKVSIDDKAEMLIEAKRLFKIDYFTKAIPMFEELISANYKPAESNFYLGEMWYYRKDYSKAISYFKKSAMLYDKAEWMPKLLLHSAISFEKTNDFKNAASFYETLMTVYPDSKEAKSADRNLSKLN